MSRERFDMRMDPETRANVELVQLVHPVSKTEVFKSGVIALLKTLGISKPSVDDYLKKK
jgi:hypothetical protein